MFNVTAVNSTFCRRRIFANLVRKCDSNSWREASDTSAAKETSPSTHEGRNSPVIHQDYVLSVNYTYGANNTYRVDNTVLFFGGVFVVRQMVC
jgi:hypothetical protein